VERRGQQRRRRARASAVGAVVAVVAVVSVVGTQVASDRADTAPARPPGFDDSNGRLARAVESGDALVYRTTLSDAGAALTEWIHFPPRFREEADPLVQGFSLAVDGETYWSQLAYRDLQAIGLRSDGFLVETRGSGPALHLADADGFRQVELTPTAADLASGDYDGFVVLHDKSLPSRIYAVDAQTSMAAPVEELAAVTPYGRPTQPDIVQSHGGALAAVDVASRPASLVTLTNDGDVRRFRLPSKLQANVASHLLAASVDRDGRPVLLWADGPTDRYGELRPPMTLKLTTIIDSTLHTFDYDVDGFRIQDSASAVSLPDGRLLVNTGDAILRTTDATLRDVEELDLSSIASSSDLNGLRLDSTAGQACLVPEPNFSLPSVEAHCTSDGESWESIDLTP
jgi:hypothetical protein